MKQVEINAELRITYKLPDDGEVNSIENLEIGLTETLQDELNGLDESQQVKVRVIVRGIDVIKEND